MSGRRSLERSRSPCGRPVDVLDAEDADDALAGLSTFSSVVVHASDFAVSSIASDVMLSDSTLYTCCPDSVEICRSAAVAIIIRGLATTKSPVSVIFCRIVDFPRFVTIP